MEKTVLSIIFVLAIAGCVGQTTGPTQIDIADVLVAENQPVIPSQPTAGSTFTFRTLIKNQHPTEFADGVTVTLFDSGKCQPTELKTPLLGPTKFAPGQQEIIKIDFDAPTKEQIVGLSAVCPIRYKVSYNFDAKSELGFNVMSTERFNQVEAETGERPVSEPRTNIGPGPLRIQLTPKTTLPVEIGKRFQFDVSVKDDGTGTVNGGAIEPGKLKLEIPVDVLVDETVDIQNNACNGKFVKDTSDNTTKITYYNKDKIDFIQDQTNPISCYFKAPGSDKVPIEKQYTISANIIDYVYDYIGQQVDVTIKP